jgi:hypothetical protein
VWVVYPQQEDDDENLQPGADGYEDAGSGY